VIGFVKRLWAAAPIATLVLALALAAAGVFAVRGTIHAVYWGDPAHRMKPIEPWMTPGFIGRAWHIPREQVIEALNAPVPPPHGPMNLEELAQYRGVPLETVLGEAEALVGPYRTEPDGPPPTEPGDGAQ